MMECAEAMEQGKDGEVLIFESEKAACEYLGVVKCSISSCYRRGVKCKGYKIAKMDKEAADDKEQPEEAPGK